MGSTSGAGVAGDKRLKCRPTYRVQCWRSYVPMILPGLAGVKQSIPYMKITGSRIMGTREIFCEEESREKDWPLLCVPADGPLLAVDSHLGCDEVAELNGDTAGIVGNHEGLVFKVV